jgi:regulator of RNase E activity RraA
MASIKRVSALTLETLQKYDSATICNVIELFGVRPSTAGYMTCAIRAVYPDLPPIVGYATTATFRSAYPAPHDRTYFQVPDHVGRMQEFPEPRIAVVQDLDDPPAAATLGEVMCRLYRRFGCCGIITSGAARDIQQVRALNFPVFASSIIVSHGHSRFEEIHVPVHIHGVTVRPGDLLHADVNGVVSVPHEIAEHVAEACEEYLAIEKMVIDYLERDDATPQGYRMAEQDAEELIQRLSAKVRERIGRDEGTNE